MDRTNRNRVKPVIILVMVFCHYNAHGQNRDQIPALDCVINPYQTIDLASPVSGVLQGVAVEHGDYVNEGDIIARLNSNVESASVILAQARAGITSEISVNNVNHNFDIRRKKRFDSLYKSNSVSFDAKDQADREYNLSKWRLKQAKDLQEIRTLELERAKQQLEQKTIRSPINGFVTKKHLNVGEYVDEQPIARLAQLNPLRIKVIVPLQYYTLVKQDQSAKVFPESQPTDSVTAIIESIDPMADAASGTFSIELTLENTEFKILAGQKCLIHLDTSKKTQYQNITSRE